MTEGPVVKDKLAVWTSQETRITDGRGYGGGVCPARAIEGRRGDKMACLVKAGVAVVQHVDVLCCIKPQHRREMMVIAGDVAEYNRVQPCTVQVAPDDMREGFVSVRVGQVRNPECAVPAKALWPHPNVVDHLLATVNGERSGIFHSAPSFDIAKPGLGGREAVVAYPGLCVLRANPTPSAFLRVMCV